MDMGLWPAVERAFAAQSQQKGFKLGSDAEFKDEARRRFVMDVTEVKHLPDIGVVVVGTVLDGAVHFGDLVAMPNGSTTVHEESVDGIKKTRDDAVDTVASAATGEEVAVLFKNMPESVLAAGDRIRSALI